MGRPSVSRGGDIPVPLVGGHPRRSRRWGRVRSPATPASVNRSRSLVVRRVGCVAGIGCVAVIPSAGRHGKTTCHGRMSFRRLLCRGPHRLDFARRLPGLALVCHRFGSSSAARGSLWTASAPETRVALSSRSTTGSHWFITGAGAARPWPRSAWSSRKTDSVRKPPDPEFNGQAGDAHGSSGIPSVCRFRRCPRGGGAAHGCAVVSCPALGVAQQ